MKEVFKYGVLLSLAAPLFLNGCVSQSKYDEAVAQNQQLQQQVASLSAQVNSAQAQVGRLQSAIKYTVDSDLLFPPGRWEMSAAGKDVIGKFTSKLAPTQREALLLAVLEGQSYEVIAAHTGVSVGTVKSRISRARDTLERLLLEGEHDPVLECLGQRRRRRGVDDDRRSLLRRAGCLRPRVEDVREHRPAAQVVEDLGRARFHPRAEACRHHDGNGPRRRIGWWRGHVGRRSGTVAGRPSPPRRSGPGARASDVM